jgi:hypothetical protein
MAEATLPTFEEAKRCPKCNQPGEDRATRPAPGLVRGTTLHVIYCVTKLCPWFETSWFVQVNPDGSVPAPKNHSGEPKIYSGFEGHDEYAEKLLAAAKAMNEASMQEGGGEIRNPNTGR